MATSTDFGPTFKADRWQWVKKCVRGLLTFVFWVLPIGVAIVVVHVLCEESTKEFLTLHPRTDNSSWDRTIFNLCSYFLVHTTTSHLLNNLFTLALLVGLAAISGRKPTCGFLLVHAAFFAASVFGGAVHFYTDPDPVAGASAGIMGLAGLCFVDLTHELFKLGAIYKRRPVTPLTVVLALALLSVRLAVFVAIFACDVIATVAGSDGKYCYVCHLSGLLAGLAVAAAVRLVCCICSDGDCLDLGAFDESAGLSDATTSSSCICQAEVRTDPHCEMYYQEGCAMCGDEAEAPWEQIKRQSIIKTV